MELKLDLHIHTNRSPDGRMTPDEIVARAKAAGLDGVALCDHDQVWSELPQYPDFLLIPGTEVSTDQGHLLGLFVTQPILSRNFADAVKAIRAQGGIAVLAHPFARRYQEDALNDIPCMPDGAEVWNGRADRKNPKANQMASRFVRQNSLLAFAGSDAHLPQEIGNGITTVSVSEPSLAAVKEALLSATAVTGGIRGKARHVAFSQLTKRRKEHAAPLAYLKWFLFTLKCLMQDACMALWNKGG